MNSSSLISVQNVRTENVSNFRFSLNTVVICGYDTMYLGRWVPTFWKNILLTSFGVNFQAV